MIKMIMKKYFKIIIILILIIVILIITIMDYFKTNKKNKLNDTNNKPQQDTQIQQNQNIEKDNNPDVNTICDSNGKLQQEINYYPGTKIKHYITDFNFNEKIYQQTIYRANDTLDYILKFDDDENCIERIQYRDNGIDKLAVLEYQNQELYRVNYYQPDGSIISVFKDEILK